MATVFLAIGTNLGDRWGHIDRALEALARHATVTARSTVFETAPMYVTDQPRFLNLAVAADTALEPVPLLDALKDIERAVGRTPGIRNGARVIDLDILAYDGIALATDRLEIPHPRLHERSFVLRPLAEIAPRWRHPTLGRTPAEMLAALAEPDDTMVPAVRP